MICNDRFLTNKAVHIVTIRSRWVDIGVPNLQYKCHLHFHIGTQYVHSLGLCQRKCLLYVSCCLQEKYEPYLYPNSHSLYCICDLGEEINHKRPSFIKEGVRWPYVGIIRSNLRILSANFNEFYCVRNQLEFKRWRHVLTLISSRTSSFINLNYRLSTISGAFFVDTHRLNALTSSYGLDLFYTFMSYLLNDKSLSKASA